MLTHAQVDVRYGLSHMPTIHLRFVLPRRRSDTSLKPKVVQVLQTATKRKEKKRKRVSLLPRSRSDTSLKPNVVHVLAPPGERMRVMCMRAYAFVG